MRLKNARTIDNRKMFFTIIYGEGIVATLSVTFRHKSTGVVTTIPTLHHWRFKDGKASALRVTGI